MEYINQHSLTDLSALLAPTPKDNAAPADPRNGVEVLAALEIACWDNSAAQRIAQGWDALSTAKRWVAWREDLRNGKPVKTPYCGPQRLAKSNDSETWMPKGRAELLATELLSGGQRGGVGLMLGDGFGGIDLDSCYDAVTGTLEPWAAEVVERFASYAEISPSGAGVKVFFRYAAADLEPLRATMRTDWSKSWSRGHHCEIALHLGNRYFAFTGQNLPGTPAEMQPATMPALQWLIESAGPRFKGDVAAPGTPKDESRSGKAFRLAGKMKRAGESFEQYAEAMRADPDLAEWAEDERQLRRAWDNAKGGVGINDDDFDDLDAAPQKRHVLFPGDPMPSARAMVADLHTKDGMRTLRHYRGTFWQWDGACYRDADKDTVKKGVWLFLERALKQGKESLVPFAPTIAATENVMAATRAVTGLPASVPMPSWLKGGDGLPPVELLPVANGLLHLPSGRLLAPTPAFFGSTASGVAFDPEAPQPAEWLRFLSQAWPDDQESIDTLQEVFGLLLSADTSHQKIPMIVGPKRSGKGTIARVLTALLGQDSVAGPTLGSLATNFGLAPLIGKSVAIIADARLSGKADQAAIAERLLSISGEDSLTIDRKYQDAWTGRLGVRLVIMSNELPRLADASGALASRFLVLTMQESFYGREDRGLGNRLMGELPGILNWARAGYLRLQDRGYFVPPASAQEAVEELEALGSPVAAFVKECCTVAPGQRSTVDAVYEAWRVWCSKTGRQHPGTAQVFGKDLRAAVPGLKISQHREGGDRVRSYEGISVNATPDPFDD